MKKIDKTKRVLITGSVGFIGFHLAKRLLDMGIPVDGLDNMNTYYDIALKKERLNLLKENQDYNFILADLVDKDKMNDIFMAYKPEIVVNLAAQAGVRYSIENPEAYIQSNIIGFFNILECCRAHGISHLIYASSSSVYGANKKIPFSVEDCVDKPMSLYAATKKSNELMAYSYSNLYHIPSTGLRFFTVYGPYGRPDMAYYSFAQKIMKGESIKVYNNGDMYRDFTYIDDIVEAIINIINNPPGIDENGTRHKVYNIGNHTPVRLMDFIQILEECLGKKAKKEFLPMQKGDVYQTYADVTELMKDFQFQPSTDLKVGLENFAQWFLKWNI